MNKEAGSYIKNLVKGRGFIIDFVNTILSVIILLMVLFNVLGPGTGVYFMHIFAFGAILCLLNCIKKIRSGSGFAIAFAMLTILLSVVAVLCYMRF